MGFKMISARLSHWRRKVKVALTIRHIYARVAGDLREALLNTKWRLAVAGSDAGKVIAARGKRWRRNLSLIFTERHVYIRASGQVRGMVLTTRRQVAITALGVGVILWSITSTVGFVLATRSANASGERAQRVRVAYEHLIATHDARIVAAVDTMTKSRADRLRTTLRLAGVNPDTLSKPTINAEGGPLIEAKDPRAIAAMLDVNRPLAEHLQRTAKDASDVRDLADASSALPLARPTAGVRESSGFGVRPDPFTGRPAFHPGLDFPAPLMTPIYSTAPGVISFTGVRNGYGNTIEIDHGQGFKTRFAHLAAIGVHTGQRVSIHERIGAIGSTGRSTGPHLHYEVWRDGRPQDPERFLKAGDYVQQAG